MYSATESKLLEGAARAATSGRAGLAPSAWLDFALPVLIGLSLTVPLTWAGLDLSWQMAIYEAGEGTWGLGKQGGWPLLYKVGPLPALLVTAAAIAGLVTGLRWSRFRRARRVLLYLFLLMLLAPGVAVNLILKENWGRPRPREIVEFGGRYAYEPLHARDPTSDGKSFACGHASMGFFFFGGWFLLRRHRRRAALICFVGALLAGGAIGLMRMLQGGHFASDVLWSGVLCYLVAASLYYALGLHRSLWDRADASAMEARVPWWGWLGGVALLSGLAVAALYAMPYEAKRDVSFGESNHDGRPLDVSLLVAMGELKVVPGASLHIRAEAFGHGLPGAEIEERWDEGNRDGVYRIRYQERRRGKFVELNQQMKVAMPWHALGQGEIGLEEPGWMHLHLSPAERPVDLSIQATDSELVILLEKGVTLWLRPGESLGDFNMDVAPELASRVVIGGERPDRPGLVAVELGGPPRVLRVEMAP